MKAWYKCKGQAKYEYWFLGHIHAGKCSCRSYNKEKKSNACTKHVRLNKECRNMKSYRNCTNFKDLQMLLKGIGRYIVKQYEEEVEKKNRRQKADLYKKKD